MNEMGYKVTWTKERKKILHIQLQKVINAEIENCIMKSI